MTHFHVYFNSDPEEDADGAKRSEPEATKASAVAKSLSCVTLGIVLLQICCEVSKQVSIYSVQYLNHGKYPVPQTFMVVAMETMKLVATVVRAGGKRSFVICLMIS